MDTSLNYNIIPIKRVWIRHIIYWIISAFLLFFIFSSREYSVYIKLILICWLSVINFFTTLIINKHLIPKILFKGKQFLFIYSILAIFILTFWVILFSVFLILAYSAFNLPNVIIPQRQEIIILIAGNYLFVIMASVIHFIKEAYSRQLEKNNIEKQKQETELKLKEAKQKLLQGQIHPHFLFNMLNNLYALVNNDVETSREVIIKLSDLLEYILYKCDKPKVLLKDELAFIQNYIKLEKVRHPESVKINIDFPLDTKGIKIAPLLLFSFVENAFKHGTAGNNQSFVNIKLKLKKEIIEFMVENPVSDKKDDAYLKQEEKGIGIKNTKERLELTYKNNYKLNIHHGGTFKVELKIYV